MQINIGQNDNLDMKNNVCEMCKTFPVLHITNIFKKLFWIMPSFQQAMNIIKKDYLLKSGVVKDILKPYRGRKFDEPLLRAEVFSVLSGIRAGRSIFHGRLEAKNPWFRLGHLRVDELQYCHPCIALDLDVQFKL